MAPESWLALPILFLAVLCRATFGFGDALLSMPLLVLLLGAECATPLVGLVALTVGLGILARSWREVAWGETWRLIVASALAVPLGVYGLRHAPEQWVKAVLGVLLIVYALIDLRRPAGVRHLESERWAWPFGFAAGLLGGAYNTNGPPVVLYGSLRGWEPGMFRVTLQGYFLPTGVVVVLGHALSGLWTRQVGLLYAGALPVVAAALALGGWLHPRLPPGRFERALHLLLILLGALLLVPWQRLGM